MDIDPKKLEAVLRAQNLRLRDERIKRIELEQALEVLYKIAKGYSDGTQRKA